MTSPVILVGRTGRGNVAGDLRPAGMRPGQCSGEGDAGAGDLCTGRVRKSERRGDGDCGAASADGDEATTAVSWFAPLSMVMVWPALKPIALATGITVAPTSVAAPTVVAPAVPTVAMTAVSRFAPVSIMIVWPAAKSATLATLILVAPAAEAADRVVAGCIRKSVQLLSVSAPSGKRPALLLVAPAAEAAGPKPPAAAGRRHAAATLPCSGGGLVTLGGPWVDEAAVVEAVDDQAGGVTQHHVAGGWGRGRGPRTTGWAPASPGSPRS